MSSQYSYTKQAKNPYMQTPSTGLSSHYQQRMPISQTPVTHHYNYISAGESQQLFNHGSSYRLPKRQLIFSQQKPENIIAPSAYSSLQQQQ
jgi:hypothetical protein